MNTIKTVSRAPKLDEQRENGFTAHSGNHPFAGSTSNAAKWRDKCLLLPHFGGAHYGVQFRRRTHGLGYTSEEMVGKQNTGHSEHRPFFHLESEMIARGLELTAETSKQVVGFDVFVEKIRSAQPEERE